LDTFWSSWFSLSLATLRLAVKTSSLLLVYEFRFKKGNFTGVCLPEYRVSSITNFVQTWKQLISPSTSLHHTIIFIRTVNEYGLDDRISSPKKEEEIFLQHVLSGLMSTQISVQNMKLCVNFIVRKHIKICRRFSILVKLRKKIRKVT
jgi:hypothetical protein